MSRKKTVSSYTLTDDAKSMIESMRLGYMSASAVVEKSVRDAYKAMSLQVIMLRGDSK